MIFVTARSRKESAASRVTASARCCASESRGGEAPILARRRVKMTPTRMTRRAEESDRRPLYSLSRRASNSLVETPRRHGHARRIPADTAGRKRGAPLSRRHTMDAPISRCPSRLLRRRSSMLIGFPFLKRVRAPYHILLISSHTIINSNS